MSIAVECPSCRASFGVGYGHAGRRGRCPKCRGEVVVPSPVEATGPQAVELFNRFFMDSVSLIQPLPLPPDLPAAPTDLKAAKAALVDARRDMEVLREDNLAALARLNVLAPRAFKAEAALLMLRAGCRLTPSEFLLQEATPVAAEAALATALDGIRRLSASFEPFQEAAARRLAITVAMLQDDRVLARVSGGPTRRICTHTVYPTAAYLGRQVVATQSELMHANQVVAQLAVVAVRAKGKAMEAFAEPVDKACRKLGRQLESIRGMLAATRHSPLLDEDGPITLVEHILPRMPRHDSPVELMETADRVQEAVTDLHRHLIGRLAVGAEEVEKALGLDPLKSAAD
ncbi:hypothetical protein [Paludisphaera mucosa]|uniref:Uncharacterized protein n=1 Tax=Paludisphaera mucosa TaxID=3030827 RepID=A0ABT6FH42_9BACT|nr:hypothetical protein [Paludisphaera mucosa]MDG3006903.1 hypothetical protein [Paludisphaera mucosa]